MDAGSLTTRTDSYPSICISSLQVHLCLLQQGVFTTSAGVLSRRRTLIALFSRAPEASHFNWAIIIIRIRVIYESIIRLNTSSLFAHYSDRFEFESNVWYSPNNNDIFVKVSLYVPNDIMYKTYISHFYILNINRIIWFRNLFMG